MNAEREQSQTSLIMEIRNWFVGEVAAGDESLQYWVDRIDCAITDEAERAPEPPEQERML